MTDRSAWCPGVLVVAFCVLAGCNGRGTPPKRIDKDASSAPKPSAGLKAAESSPDVAAAGARYLFDPTCKKCQKTRGDGCVATNPEGKPLGCGWVSADGNYAAVAWINRNAAVPETIWWYGADGKTKAFWTPCETASCDASVSFESDGVAAVSFGLEDEKNVVRYDVDGGKVLSN